FPTRRSSDLESQAYLALAGFDGARSRVSEAEAERAWRRPPDLPLLVARNHGGARQPGMEHGYHLYPDGTRIPVPGCGDGLVQPSTEPGRPPRHLYRLSREGK